MNICQLRSWSPLMDLLPLYLHIFPPILLLASGIPHHFPKFMRSDFIFFTNPTYEWLYAVRIVASKTFWIYSTWSIKGVIVNCSSTVCHWEKSGWEQERRNNSRHHGRMLLTGSRIHCKGVTLSIVSSTGETPCRISSITTVSYFFV